MNLSNRLTFSIFSFLLVALFAFVTMPAMAQVTVTVTGAYTPDDPATADGEDEELTVLTFTFSHDQATDLTLANFFTAYDAATGVGTFTTSLLTDPATDPAIWVVEKTSAKVFTLSTTTDAPTHTGAFDLYLMPFMTQIAYQAVDHDADGATPLVARFDNDDDGTYDDESVSLQVASGYIGGHAYAIIGNHIDAAGNPIALADDGGTADVDETVAQYPTMPSNITNRMRSQWSVHTDATVPDLYAHFQVGQRGTLDLVHTSDGTAMVGDKNSRSVIINEVMWARDESQVGQSGHTREQWIEVYNNTNSPILLSNIRINFQSHIGGAAAPPADAGYTDRLTNRHSYTNVWNIDGKGQDGNSNDTNLKEFISMHRTNAANGWTAGHWGAAGDLFLPNYRGTPGKANSFSGLPTARTAPAKDWPARNKIIINEIYNASGNSGDWIELRNVTDTAQSMKNWVLTLSTGFGNEDEIIRLPDKAIPANGVLLIVDSDPSTTSLANGWDLNKEAVDQAFGVNQTDSPNYIIAAKLNGSNNDSVPIPNNQDWLLILRSGNPWNVKDGRSVYQTGFQVEDVAGPGGPGGDFAQLTLNAATVTREKKNEGSAGGDIWQTKLFPLNGHTQGDGDFLQGDRLAEDKVYQRNGGKHGFEKDAWGHIGYTGIGYDYDVTSGDTNGGTPGYDNGAWVSKGADATSNVVITEIMYAQIGSGRGATPQWLELFNPSSTHGVNLGNFRIIVVAHSQTWGGDHGDVDNLVDWDGKASVTLMLSGTLPPLKTSLIASASAREDNIEDVVPGGRVLKLYNDGHRADFDLKSPGDSFINPYGFTIILQAKDGNNWQTAENIGNLAARRDAARGEVSDTERYDAPAWLLPNPLTEEGDRSSIARKMHGGPSDGKAENGWVLSSIDSRTENIERNGVTYYGDEFDISTPGLTPGRPIPLPVNLSFFRPVLENGEVVIRWTTESELDNAGFNILRSDTRNGEYKQVNTKLIQGKGTTGERSTYRWVDATAKPNAVYYYQIEDVSFAGERQTLATTKLKGLISAKDKATTTWGEIKEVQ